MNENEINLSDLPTPNVIEELDYEQLFKERKKKLIELNPAYREVLELESEPLTIDLQVGAYREFLVRHRVNEAAQARLLAKATEADLDHLGDFYGVQRFEKENDSSYRLRIRDRIMGSSTAGSTAHYRTRAMEVNPSAIRDIAIDSPEGGLVRISVLVRSDFCFNRGRLLSELSTFKCSDYCTKTKGIGDVENNRCPDFENLSSELIEKIKDHVKSDSVKMLTDTVIVDASEKVMVDVKAEIYLQPTTPKIVFEKVVADFETKWATEAKLAWDVSPSWINAQLHHAGVHSVNLIEPKDIIRISSNQSALLNNVDIVLKGRDF